MKKTLLNKKLWLLNMAIVLALSGCGGSDEGDTAGGGDGGGIIEPPPTLPGACQGAEYQDAAAAILKRDHALASEGQLIDYSLCVLAQETPLAMKNAVVNQIYKGVSGPYSWSPGGLSHLLTGDLEHTFTLLDANKYNTETVEHQGSLILAGIKGTHRYIAFGQNILANETDVDASQLIFKNAVSWLLEAPSSSRLTTKPGGSNRIVLSDVERAFYDDVQATLEADSTRQYTLNAFGACDKDMLSACLAADGGADLLMISNDDKAATYAEVKAGVDYAIEHNIPLLSVASRVERAHPDDVLIGVYNYMDIVAKYNFGGPANAADVMPEQMLGQQYPWPEVATLLKNLKSGTFDAGILVPEQGEQACVKNLLNCNIKAFNQQFKAGADWYRSMLTSLDARGIDVLSQPAQRKILSAGLLLADKYRSHIDYPIDGKAEGSNFQRALFADWVINYLRADNRAQLDLGTFVLEKESVVKSSNASYQHEPVMADSRIFSVPYIDNWTTTGWYVQPGQVVTVASDDIENAKVEVQVNYARTDTQQVGTGLITTSPLDVSMLGVHRLVLSPGKKLTFSSPYGGPIYINFVDQEKTTAKLSITGIVKHAAILDSSETGIADFERAIDNTETPHVDIRVDGAEFHMRKDKFLGGIKGEIRDVNALIAAIKDHVDIDYTLAGYKVMGKDLQHSLPQEVRDICTNLFGAENCFDEALHTRQLIQHANYDQYAACGDGCSGNPRDGSWSIEPYGWGDNHELGHNLQTPYMDTFYVEEDNKNDWGAYEQRSGESSNNIFPYHLLWKHHKIDLAQTSILADDHSNTLDVYNVIMSDLLDKPDIYDAKCVAMPKPNNGLTDRYTSPWFSNDYDPHAFRMTFYTQMAMQADKLTMKDGTTLSNGFDIYTLLYQHSRIFNKYAANEIDWNNNRGKLGFELFPYEGNSTYGDEKTVTNMPGNDFMLVSLSFMTQQDWRPFFNMFGLRYTDLASAQVDAFNLSHAVKETLFVRKAITEEGAPDNAIVYPSKDISEDDDFIELDMTDTSVKFPGHENQACLK